MLLKYYTKKIARNVLPGRIYQYFKGVKKRCQGYLRKRAKARAISCNGRFDTGQMRAVLQSLGIRKDGVLLVQSSMNRFYNFDGTAKDVLSLLRETIGHDGTLVMPAFPLYNQDGPYFFDVNKTPSQTGILCELMRRQPGVRRSLQAVHSVCAVGPMAEELLAEHHLDAYTCGLKSPFYKIAKHDGQILGLGLPPGYTTFFHAVEDIDVQRYPRPIYVGGPVSFTVIDESGRELSVSVHLRNPKVTATMRLSRITDNLSEKAHRVLSIYGVPAFIANAKPLLEELCALRDKGIVLYD